MIERRGLGEAGSRAGERSSDIVPAMFWPLAGGFIAFVLLSLLLGWIMDTSGSDDSERH
jgi:hypothetical protein